MHAQRLYHYMIIHSVFDELDKKGTLFLYFSLIAWYLFDFSLLYKRVTGCSRTGRKTWPVYRVGTENQALRPLHYRL